MHYTTRCRLYIYVRKCPPGELADLATKQYRGTGLSLTVTFNSDESEGGKGFGFEYACGAAPPPPVSAGDYFLIDATSNSPTAGVINRASDREVYQFDAVAGHTYQMQTETGSLSDTVMKLLSSDRQTVLIENDDGEVAGHPGQASFISWTCSTAGTYYVAVMGFQRHSGTYTITIQDQEGTPPPPTYGPSPPVPARAPSSSDLSFKIRMCVDHIDDIYFQSNQMWAQYGGQWSAAGVSSCGDAQYQGKAYITVGSGTEQVWDISALAQCHSGSSCPPVQQTFDYGSFNVPQCEGMTSWG